MIHTRVIYVSYMYRQEVIYDFTLWYIYGSNVFIYGSYLLITTVYDAVIYDIVLSYMASYMMHI